MFANATFREILLPSSVNVNDCIAHIYIKYADLDGRYIAELAEKTKKTQLRYCPYHNFDRSFCVYLIAIFEDCLDL